jgi:DNA replication and repair protein RecF
MAFIKDLQCTYYRSYDSLQLTGLTQEPVVLCGTNGAGKTNILEAISVLTPGRGLRGAKMGEYQNIKSPAQVGWAVSAVAETLYGETRLGVGRDIVTDKRLVRINGQAAKSQSMLGEYLSCVWLTPQMDRLFIEGAASRRKFMDRLVFAFDPAHAGRVTRYENAMSQRSKVLRDNEQPDENWLKALEANMAQTGVAIAAARLSFMQYLQAACDATDEMHAEFFPKALVRARGTIEELLQNAPAVEVEDMFRYQLHRTRLQDAQFGGSATGPHKSDMEVVYAAKAMPADHCSTGEQKALLVGILLAHSRMIEAERGAAPILLLDEVAAHLDSERRARLFSILLSLTSQVWLTGTDDDMFSSLRNNAQFFKVSQGTVLPS